MSSYAGGFPGRQERLTFGHGSLAAVPTRRTAATAALSRDEKPVHLLRIDTWDWGWGGLLLFSALLFLRPQDQIGALFGALHMSDISAAVGLLGMVAVNVGRGQPLFRVTPEVAAVTLLGLLILATAPFGIWPGGSIGIFTSLFMQVTLIFLLIVNTVSSPKRINRLCKVIVFAFGYIAIRVCLDYLRGANLVEGNRAAGPAGGFFESPNDLALNLAAFLPLVIMYARHGSTFFTRFASAGIAALMTLALIFTKSRGGFIAIVAALAVYLVTARMLRPRNILVLVLGGVLLLPAVPSSFWERMASITDASKDPTGSRKERIELMTQAWSVFKQHPFTGIGAGQFENYQEPGQVQHWRVTHNTPLQLAAEVGIVGVLLMLFLFLRGLSAARWTAKTLRRTTRAQSRRGPPPAEDGLNATERVFLQELSAALVACMVGWFVASQFASVAYNWTFYYLLGLCVVVRIVVRARARTYAQARKAGSQEVVAA